VKTSFYLSFMRTILALAALLKSRAFADFFCIYMKAQAGVAFFSKGHLEIFFEAFYYDILLNAADVLSAVCSLENRPKSKIYTISSVEYKYFCGGLLSVTQEHDPEKIQTSICGLFDINIPPCQPAPPYQSGSSKNSSRLPRAYTTGQACSHQQTLNPADVDNKV
jgi:hypothetical protein